MDEMLTTMDFEEELEVFRTEEEVAQQYFFAYLSVGFGSATAIANGAVVALLPRLSTACRRRPLAVDRLVGVPEIRPAEDSARPGGSVPCTSEKETPAPDAAWIPPPAASASRRSSANDVPDDSVPCKAEDRFDVVIPGREEL
jgi:hypothetical protein